MNNQKKETRSADFWQKTSLFMFECPPERQNPLCALRKYRIS